MGCTPTLTCETTMCTQPNAGTHNRSQREHCFSFACMREGPQQQHMLDPCLIVYPVLTFSYRVIIPFDLHHIPTAYNKPKMSLVTEKEYINLLTKISWKENIEGCGGLVCYAPHMLLIDSYSRFNNLWYKINLEKISLSLY